MTLQHHRRSIRLKGFDYSQPGAYFVTIVTQECERLFGKIVNGKVLLNEFGMITDECWHAIPEHFPNVELGAYVVMPNHVHGIIVIHDIDDYGGTIYRAPIVEKFGKPTVNSLPTIVRTYKAAVTRRIGRELNATKIWQRNYYERVIRNEKEWDRIHRYIESNPAYWTEDNENPLKM